MFEIFHSPAADNEILEAAKWYDLQQEGLGSKFIDDLEILENYMETNPLLFPQKYRTIRQASMKRFPYVILFKVEQNAVFILSVFNCYQNPRKKKIRLK